MSGVTAEVELNGGSTLVASKAVILYQGKGAAFATVHDIRVSDGSPELLAGKPLSARALRAMRSKLEQAHRRRGVLPPNVLAVDEETLIWHEPAQQRHMAFKLSDQFPGRSIGTVSGRVPCPGVVFVVRRDRWKVLAYKGRARPGAETRLYFAPMFNVGHDHEICAGTVKKPSSCAVTAIGEWSNAFFGSFFSHANYDGVVRHRGDVMGLWKELLKSPGRRFPERTLLDAGLTLGQLVERAGL